MLHPLLDLIIFWLDSILREYFGEQMSGYVLHGLLLCKLMLVDSYLNGRTQFERCGEKESSVGRVTCGVPQESVLGPFLFISYILKWRFEDFIFLRIISRFITVLVFRIYKGVMMRSTWICSRYMSGQRRMDWSWIRKRAR
jgi:hypothetical protein